MSIGPLQIVLILVLVLVLFGAGKLPSVMGDMGKGIKNFKKGMNEDTTSDEAKSLPSDHEDKKES